MNFFFHVRHYKPNIPPAALMFINSNVKNNCDILSNEFVQDFLENPKFKNATKLSTFSKSSGPIVQCGSFTYLMDSLTNFLPAFVTKICKKSCEQSKIQNLFRPKKSKLHLAIWQRKELLLSNFISVQSGLRVLLFISIWRTNSWKNLSLFILFFYRLSPLYREWPQLSLILMSFYLLFNNRQPFGVCKKNLKCMK